MQKTSETYLLQRGYFIVNMILRAEFKDIYNAHHHRKSNNFFLMWLQKSNGIPMVVLNATFIFLLELTPPIFHKRHYSKMIENLYFQLCNSN